jgi:hypothetical protein
MGPSSVILSGEDFFLDNISVRTYVSDELEALLGTDRGFWSKVYFSLDYKKGYWLKLDLEADVIVEAYDRAVSQISRFFEALGLFKSTLSMLALGGLYVKMMEKGEGPTGQFGWENSIVARKRYPLQKEEYNGFTNLLTKYAEFWNGNEITAKSHKQLQRIDLARDFFLRSFQTPNLVDRHIFLSIVLEALMGGEQAELQYRYSNRAALLLGDDAERRKAVCSDVKRAYKIRSKILHGETSWVVKPEEVLNYSEIIRQMILRCISLHSQGYRNITKALDKCLHDPKKHLGLLEDARALFGPPSEYKEPQESRSARGWATRN